MTRVATAAAILIVLLCPGAAHAATASVKVTEQEGYKGSDDSYSTIEYVASPGEPNRLVATGDRFQVTLHDDGAPIDPGRNCVALDPHTVRCAAGTPALFDLDILLADGDDEFAASRPEDVWIYADGGDGADRLEGGGHLAGGPGDDIVIGGDEYDEVSGGEGRDTVMGGGGSDQFSEAEGTPADDTIDGGPGADRVSYVARRAPVTIDLRAARGGAKGETDTYVSVENATGGSGKDVISGDDGPNDLAGGENLAGGPGDLLRGRGGDDELRGTERDDVLDGGPGDDLLSGNGGVNRSSGGTGDDRLDVGQFADERNDRQSVSCGPGRDDVFYPTVVATITADCETASTEWYTVQISSLLTSRPVLKATMPSEPGGASPACGLAEIAGAGGRFRSPRLRVPVKRYSSVRFPAGSRSAVGRTVRFYASDTCSAKSKLRFMAGFRVAR